MKVAIRVFTSEKYGTKIVAVSDSLSAEVSGCQRSWSLAKKRSQRYPDGRLELVDFPLTRSELYGNTKRPVTSDEKNEADILCNEVTKRLSMSSIIPEWV